MMALSIYVLSVIITGNLLAVSVEPELKINDVRSSRVVLLDGINSAIQRLASQGANHSERGGFDTSQIAELLQADQLDAAIQELNILEAKVIEVYGLEAAQKEVIPQINNLIAALEKQ